MGFAARVLAVGLVALACAAASTSAWAVDPVTVERLAFEGGLGELSPFVGLAARDAVQVRRTVTPGVSGAVGVSRLGGAPDLPLDTRWPTCAGRPMAFLGQIRAEELPPGSGLPPAGLLGFFTQVAEDRLRPRRYLWAGDCSAIVHTTPERTVRRRPAPRARPRLVLRPATVALRPDVSLPAVGSSGALGAPLDAVRLGELDRRRYAGLRDALRGPGFRAHRLLGYPDAADEDPRVQCAVAEGGAPAEWRLVLQLDADPELRWRIAGSGRLSILVRDGAGLAEPPCSVFGEHRP